MRAVWFRELVAYPKLCTQLLHDLVSEFPAATTEYLLPETMSAGDVLGDESGDKACGLVLQRSRFSPVRRIIDADR